MRQPENVTVPANGPSAGQPVEKQPAASTAVLETDHGLQGSVSVLHPSKFDMEVLVGYILLVGVLTSMALIITGLIWRCARTGQFSIDYNISGMNFFEFAIAGLRQVGGDQFRPRLLVNLGIVALLLTPYVRVLASMVYFAFAARNWKYTLFTAFVLSVLTYSLVLR